MTATLASGATPRGGLRSPGRLYNLGNAIGLAAGVVVAVASRPASGDASLWSAGADYVLGSRSAALMTLSTLVFFAGGEFYGLAFRSETSPSVAQVQIRRGDLLSGLGAIMLAAALASIGDPVLAALSGLLNAGGRLGCAWLGGAGQLDRAWRRRVMRSCRVAVLLSRLPAAAAALSGLAGAAASGDSPGLVLSAVMLGCLALWATADVLLMTGEQATAPRR